MPSCADPPRACSAKPTGRSAARRLAIASGVRKCYGRDIFACRLASVRSSSLRAATGHPAVADRPSVVSRYSSQRARRRSLRCAGQRYQNSPSGRRRHAARQRRYRGRDKKVTHHGSPPPRGDDLLASGSPVSASDAAALEDRPRRTITHCHWCGRRCPQLIRQGFLRRRGHRRDRL